MEKYNGYTVEQLKDMQKRYESLSEDEKLAYAEAAKQLPAEIRGQIYDPASKEIGYAARSNTAERGEVETSKDEER